MAKIELQDVTKRFSKPAPFAGSNYSRRVLDGQTDKAFAERIVEHAEAESSTRAGTSSGVLALDHVNLTIPDGQTISIVGPSGCGKSTLLRVVAGLETDISGRVLYDGQDMQSVPVKERMIGMVFQSYALYPHFKGEGNLSFFFKVRKITDQEAEERIRITAQTMGIGFDALLDRKPRTLSGGQQQRVAIARAIVRNPRLFLFDEPLSNLDAKLRVQTRLEIKRLLHRFNITTIYVTHDQIEAIALSDLIAVMRAGKVEQVGDYATLRNSPATSFVAGFLGLPPMNLLTGGSVGDGVLRIGEWSIPLPDAIKAQVRTGQSLTLGMRPEDARLISSSSSNVAQTVSDGVRMRGVVDMVEPDFSRQIQTAFVRSGEHAFGVMTELDATIAGATVEVSFPHDQLFFFDAETERRLGAQEPGR